jgi:hypothetical protein
MGKPYPKAGQIGRFDVTTHKQTYQVEKYAPGFIEQTTGGVWVTEANNASANPTIDRYTSVGGRDTRIRIGVVPFQPQPGSPNGLAGGIAIGADQQLWFGSNSTAQVGEVNPSGNAVKLYHLKPPGTSLPEPECAPQGVPPSRRSLPRTRGCRSSSARSATPGLRAQSCSMHREHLRSYRPGKAAAS